ncbi:3201_t:CDS:1, partial [Racocetra persica]
DILYIALVYEVIPNILTLQNLAMDLEREKVERRKELNIMDPSDHKLLMQEFSQVAYLSPSIKWNESAKKLLEMKKVIKFEITSKKIYVEVESESFSRFIYTTCVYGQPKDICCQCFDFLQTGILCKHLRAAALYINKLRKQEQYMYLPKITFPTYQEAQQIYYNQYADRSEMPISSEINNEDNDNVDDENENIDNESNNHDNNDNSPITTSSKKILNYIGHILGINAL